MRRCRSGWRVTRFVARFGHVGAGTRVARRCVTSAATLRLVVDVSDSRHQRANWVKQNQDGRLSEDVVPSRDFAYPIVNWPGDPLPNVGAGYGTHDDDQGWEGTIGVPHADDAPISVVAVHVFPVGWDTSFPDSRPGRVADVEETTVNNDNTTLTWKVGVTPVVVSGNDVDLLYQLVDLIDPIDATVQRGGYQFNGPLPNGLSEFGPPYHRIAMRSPIVSTDDGTFSVGVEQGPILDAIVGGGITMLDRVTINGLNGYKSTTGDPTIALAITTDETLYLSTSVLTMEQLTAIANGVTITDDATWRAHYGLAD